MTSSALVPIQPRTLLRRLVEEPGLVTVVRGLDARALSKLIEHVGLEDSGEIVSLATSRQLEHLFDEDLWRNDRPGREETFDGARFALWMEILTEAGEDVVAERLAELPEEMLVLGLHRQALVVDLAELFAALSDVGGDEVELTEKALDGCLYLELGDYQLISRGVEGWDALVSALLALDKHHHDQLERILGRCCRASLEQIEESGGLYQLLGSEDLLELDAAAGRDERRSSAGYVAPASAAAFLKQARTTPLEELVAQETRDPITRSYFRDLGSRDEDPVPQAPAALGRLLVEAGIIDEARPSLLLESGSARAERSDGAEPSFQGAMAELFDRDPSLYARRMDELAYLANTLAAGAEHPDGRRYRSSEAVEAVLTICERGFQHLLALEPADKLFRIGWHLLHRSC